MSDAETSLPDRLRAIIAERDTSIHGISKASGMELMMVHRIISGKTVNPGIHTVRRILEAMGATLGDIYPPSKKSRKKPGSGG